MTSDSAPTGPSLAGNSDEVIRDGEAAEEAGDLVGAAAAFASLLNHPDARVAAVVRYHLGRVVRQQGQPDEARTLFEAARAAAIGLNDKDLRALVENAIGVLHVERGEYVQARAACAVALELEPEPRTRAKIALNLGVIANLQGRFDVARRQFAQSESLYRMVNDERGVSLVLYNMGMLHADRDEWDEADEVFRQALTLFEAHENRQMIASAMISRAEVSYGRGRAFDGVAHCDMALSMYAELGDETGRGWALRWKGRGLRLLGRHPEGEQALSEALRIASRTHLQVLEAESSRELAWTLRARGNAEEARGALERSLELFEELGAAREIQEIRSELAAPQ